ncbi:MAG: hypothetical protein ABIJ21_00650 [Nanoarchaeota archaeon]
MKRAPFILSAAAVFFGYIAGCAPKTPDPADARQRIEQAEPASTIAISKAERPSHDEDDGYYKAGTRQYRIAAGGKTIDTLIPDLAQRGHDPDFTYFVILEDRTGQDVSIDRLAEDIEEHPEYQRFVRYILRDDNRPIRPMKTDKAKPEQFEPDSMADETYLLRFYSKNVKIEREDIDKVTPHLTSCTRFEGTLEDVLAQANEYQNTQYETWKRTYRNARKPDRVNDLEGFYMLLKKKVDGNYALDIYGVSIIGQTPDGRTVEF